MRVGWLICMILLVTIAGCSKRKGSDLEHSRLQLPDNVAIRQTQFLSENIGYAVGGKRDEIGYIYKTIDGGANWSTFSTGEDLGMYSIHFINDSIGFAGGDFLRIYRTVNGGDTWQRLPQDGSNLPYHEVHRPAIRTIDFANATDGYYVGGENYEVGVIYRTKDQGLTWQFDTIRHELRGLSLVDATTSAISGHGYVGISTDGGESYSQKRYDGDFFVAVQMLSNTEILMAGQDGGIYRSTNAGDDWEKVLKSNAPFRKRRAFNDLKMQNDYGYAVGNDGLVMFTGDRGKNWERKNLDTEKNLFHIAYEGNTAYVSSEDGTVFTFNIY